jgi:hypothetical protein
MSFSVHLSPDVVPVEAGTNTPVSVTIENRSEARDRFEIQIEGLDPEWTAVPVPVVDVAPGERQTEKVFFKPPRASESLSGNYPFVLRVRSLETGEHRMVQGVIQIKGFHHLSMEISPKKGSYSPLRKNNLFTATVMNLGNTEHTVQLVGTDPEDACAYEFEHERLTVVPGQQKDVDLEVVPRSTRILSSGRLIGFTITGRSVDHPSTVTSAQAQLEQRALLSPGILAAFLMLLVIFGLWLLMMPKPPQITVSADPQRAVAGQTVRIAWSAAHAHSVRITANDELVFEGSQLVGTSDFPVQNSGTVQVRALAFGDNRQSEPSLVSIVVEEPPLIPEPTITELRAEPERVRLGETFVLHYTFGPGVNRAVLAPLGQQLDLTINQIEVRPSRAGKTEFTVVTTNEAGRSVRRSISVNVVDESNARILAFSATPTRVQAEAGRTTLSWQTTNAVRVEVVAKPAGTTTVVEPTGMLEVPVSARTTFTLIAIDAEGRRVTRDVTVEYVPPPPPPPVEPPTEPPPAFGGATAGGG